MTADPLRGDPESPECQSVRRCARLHSVPEPELAEWADVQTSAELALARRGRIATGVLTLATSLAVSAPILTALYLFILLTRRNM